MLCDNSKEKAALLGGQLCDNTIEKAELSCNMLWSQRPYEMSSATFPRLRISICFKLAQARILMSGVSQEVQVFGRFSFSYPRHSKLVGRVVNLKGTRLLFRRVLDNLAVLRSPLLGAGVFGRWGFLFLNQFGCVSPEIGLTFCYELAGQRWIEGQIDLSSSGIGPSIDHRAYSTFIEFILLKRDVKSSPSHPCISLVWKLQNVVCGFLTKESLLS
ncbi:hypothetical protein ACH5RR_023273 [Cinchona calisaya]|uniref:Uncharacterized protein n=1 Tax=Cinchona calisaya TaxID=153742 RepID=A0ABD2ZC32_9GENT